MADAPRPVECSAALYRLLLTAYPAELALVVLPPLATGFILARVRPFHRPFLAAPLGSMLLWGQENRRPAPLSAEQLFQPVLRLFFLFREIDRSRALLGIDRLFDEPPQVLAGDLVEIVEPAPRRLLRELLDLLLMRAKLRGQSLRLLFEQVLQPARLFGQFLVELVGQDLPLAFQ